MKIKVSTVSNIVTIYFIVVYFYFYQLFEAFEFKSVALSMLAISVVSNVLVSLKEMKKNSFSLLLLGWGFFLCILLFHNEYMNQGNYGSILMPISALTIVLMRTNNTKWCCTAYKAFINVGMIHIIATLIFSVFNSLYLKTMPKIWGYFPVGTQNGLNGAAAGLTRHYSYNGIYCATVMIFCFAPIVTSTVKSVNKKRMLCMSILSLFAVVLTQKRAHLLFGVLSIVMLYLFCGNYQTLNRIGKIIVWGVCAILVAGLVSVFAPSIINLFERFKMSEDLDISNGRYAAWRVGYDLFTESKLFGKGWFYFPVYYNRSEFPEVHNIYIQFLCETGIIGTAVLMCTMFGTLKVSMKALKLNRDLMDPEDRTIIVASIGFQLFIVMYGLTGCCMTDITVIAYLLSVAFGITIYKKYRFKKANVLGSERSIFNGQRWTK